VDCTLMNDLNETNNYISGL